jgi:hypothetical protein
MDRCRRTPAVDPVDARQLHAVPNEHALLHLLEQRAHDAQQLALGRRQPRWPAVQSMHAYCHKVCLRAHHLEGSSRGAVERQTVSGRTG